MKLKSNVSVTAGWLSAAFILCVAVPFSKAYDVVRSPIAVQFFQKATRAARNEKFEEAISNYQKALSYMGPESDRDFLARIHFNIGVCLFRLNRDRDAVAQLTKAIHMSNRNYQKAFYTLGMAHAELKNWAEATSAFQEAIKLREDDGEAWFDLASTLIIMNDLDGATIALQHSIKHKTVALAHAHNNLGVIFALKGKIRDAEIEFKKSLFESGDALIGAKNNLEFCKSYRQKFRQTLVGSLQFSAQIESRRQI